MILVIGGMASGKLQFVCDELGYSPEMVSEKLDDKPVLNKLHEFLYSEGEMNDKLFSELLRKEVIICNEVGCGVVPLEKSQRQWRENVGRSCTALAGEADCVIRMVCGIPQIIKGEAPWK